ncbi:MAG: glycogen synthase GlgA [Planctomycetes bacterium]|nr:glycogen synthase GlgA [Planctomycetota bacterium]
MKVAFISPEVVPYSKTGGLADVCGALPQALAGLDVETCVVTPGYRCTKSAPAEKVEAPVRIKVGDTEVAPTFRRAGRVFFVDCDPYFDREGLYGTPNGDYKDNAARFVLFCRAAMELLRHVAVPDVLHAHDWQAGLVPTYARTLYRSAYEKTKTVFTIHNLAYQGLFWHWDMPLTGLDWKHFHWKELEFFGKISFVKAGLVHSDAVVTVSPTYAREIQTPQHGCGLDGVLRERASVLHGILNGVDYAEWNPETDALLPACYSARAPAGKSSCKAALQKQCGLPEAPETPLVGMIGRLVEQKGIDLVLAVIEDLLKEDVQFVLLGSGDPRYQEALLGVQRRRPDRISVNIKFDNGLAHLIEAGSDLFLMPSRYEPCGLNQIYSLKYGTVPVVRATGGLADSVVGAATETMKKGTATGFAFADYSPVALADTMRRALGAYHEKKAWKKLMAAGMKQDFSWEKSARQYLKLYEGLTRGSSNA